jgi:phosphoribosylformylglycinamidine cyclo-ligase
MSSEGLSYAAAGVDIEAYERVLERVKPLIAATHGKQVAVGVGPFAGLYALPGGGHLAASADGVGTKIKVAIAAGVHRGIGTDIVNHCVNDIATSGAEPMFFLDYFATGKLKPELLAEIVEGVAEACREAGAALIGGETAEMPGVYALGDYDIAGFIVGVVERENLIEPSRVSAGDVLVGLPSSGLHTNGFSLVRYLFKDEQMNSTPKGLDRSLGETLLEPHRSYLPQLRAARGAVDVLGVAHITGGAQLRQVGPVRLQQGLTETAI